MEPREPVVTAPSFRADEGNGWGTPAVGLLSSASSDSISLFCHIPRVTPLRGFTLGYCTFAPRLRGFCVRRACARGVGRAVSRSDGRRTDAWGQFCATLYVTTPGHEFGGRSPAKMAYFSALTCSGWVMPPACRFGKPQRYAGSDLFLFLVS